jgi:hypothetical protein
MASKTRLLMNDELERIWKEAVVAWKRYCPSEYLERERQFANDLNRYSLCPTRVSNPEHPEYMSISYELRIPWRDRTFSFMYPTKFVINLAVYLQVIHILKFCSEVVHLCSPDLLNMLKFTCKNNIELYFGVFHGTSWLIEGSVQKELEIMSPGRKYTNLQSTGKNMSGRRKDSLLW